MPKNAREEGMKLGKAACPWGPQRGPANLNGNHQGSILILLQLLLPQHRAQDVGGVERQAPHQVCAVPSEVLRPQDGWLGAVRVAGPNQVQEQWVLMVDETGHPPKADNGVSGLEGTVQGRAGLAHQGPEGRSDAEDTLLTVNGELEVSRAVRLVLNPQALLRALSKVDPAEVDAVVLQGHIRTWAQEMGPCEWALPPGWGWGISLPEDVSERVPLMGGGTAWREKTGLEKPRAPAA